MCDLVLTVFFLIALWYFLSGLLGLDTYISMLVIENPYVLKSYSDCQTVCMGKEILFLVLSQVFPVVLAEKCFPNKGNIIPTYFCVLQS